MGRADIYPVYDQTPADYSTFDRKITLRFASDGYRINGRRGAIFRAGTQSSETGADLKTGAGRVRLAAIMRNYSTIVTDCQ
jgi:hypothetical protein